MTTSIPLHGNGRIIAHHPLFDKPGAIRKSRTYNRFGFETSCGWVGFDILFTPISIGIQTARQGKLDRHRRVSKPPRKGETAGAAGD